MKEKPENTCKYTWNDIVKIKEKAPASFHPGEVGVICGMSQIQFEETAQKYKTELHSWMYTIEFHDGSDAQVPEIYLEEYIEST